MHAISTVTVQPFNVFHFYIRQHGKFHKCVTNPRHHQVPIEQPTILAISYIPPFKFVQHQNRPVLH